MPAALWSASITFVLTGFGVAYAGRWIRQTERADLIFVPGVAALDQEIARIGGCTTILAGVATVALGIGVLFVTPRPAGCSCSARTRLSAC